MKPEEDFEQLPFLEQLTATAPYMQGFKAGAASRDAEVVSLTNQRDYEYVRAENAEQERDQLHEQVKMLRDKVDWLRRYGCKDDLAFRVAQDALAFTADLKDVILCHAEPVGSMTIFEKHEKLYRAWEPTK